MNGISVQGLAKSFGPISALKNLSFEVEKGTMFGLIGPDGGGKTTFMRIAACLLAQDSGKLAIAGFDSLREASKIRRIIGYMPQKFSLYPDLSIAENLVFFSDLFGVPKQERSRRIDELLEFSRLGAFLKRRAGDLSGGMKQKLALSCALIHTPEVLFLDEPTTGVDPVSRREFWALLAEIKKGGTTIVVSTPYMNEAEKCDNVGFIIDGAFIMEGRPKDIPGQFRHKVLAVSAPDIVMKSRKLAFPDSVIDMQTFGDRIHLTVTDSASATVVVRQFLKENGIDSPEISEIAPSMEDVFMERING